MKGFCCFNLKEGMTAEKIFSMTQSRSTAFWNNLGDITGAGLPLSFMKFIPYYFLYWIGHMVLKRGKMTKRKDTAGEERKMIFH